MNINHLNSPFKNNDNNKKSYEALPAQFSFTLHCTRRKFCYQPSIHINFVLYTLQMNEFSFSYQICTSKLINLFPR